MQKTKVLFIDDDITLGKIVTLALNESGYETYYQTSLTAIHSVIREIQPDIIILDVEIGEKNGIDITPELKIIAPETPVLFVSSHTDSDNVVKALNAGGTAYLKKPFEIEELVAYINRHANCSSSGNIPIGRLFFNAKENLLFGEDQLIRKLTLMECKLLKFLVANKNRVVTREDIGLELWGKELGNEQSLNNIITKLRKHLISEKETNLTTIPKVGYKLTL